MAYQLNKTYLLFSNSGSGKCLNVSGPAANHQNVCILDKSGSSAQNWMVKAFGSNLKLVTGLNQNYALNYYWSAGQGKPGDCNIYPQSGNDADSSIVLEPVSTDVYRIKLKNYNLYLTATGTGNNADVRWETQIPLLGSNHTDLAPQEWRFLDPSAKGIRAPFIYTGFQKDKTVYTYTDNQLSGLNNATEFVICPGVFQGYFSDDGKPAPDGNTTYIQRYVGMACDMAKRLYTMYGKQVWIGTPEVGTNVDHKKAQVFEEVGRRMTYFIDNIIAGFNNRGLNFDTIVKGIYISDEAVRGTFDANTPITDNYQISMFQTVSNYAAGKGKKMLWSPYWDTDNFKKAACVIHRTNIFDYAVMQSHYYFSSSDSSHLNCAALRTGIAIQRVTYQSGRPILHAIDITCTKTVIGCQMEIDSDYFNNLDKDPPTIQDRYKEYERVFNQSEGAYDKYNANFGFYFGCPQPGSTDDPGYDEVRDIVNNFFA